ncbi:CPBP family intramembrane metalloprotease [Infirmifilum lucidum]|uniref:CPBP family intramembrane metalloprotease n=1 Tax=Infirmifilum lucidum TaxID=2776706 RepID=A0A7L9FFU1_9CREN|nr:CPBP family intramembrane glutamic endopeptidase [Infirmifilum lucidum]QOJ78557.1 CPBP family intramembrane metalloprotease [Infirmifilum lucidum]
MLEMLWLKVPVQESATTYILAPLLVTLALLICLLLEALAGKLDFTGITRAGIVRLGLLATVLLTVLSGYLAALTVNAIFALGEEAGWRGCLYHVLAPEIGCIRTVVVVGLLWARHCDSLARTQLSRAPHRRRSPVPCSHNLDVLPLFYLRETSGNILPAVSFHGAVNAWRDLTVAAASGLSDIEGGAWGYLA